MIEPAQTQQGLHNADGTAQEPRTFPWAKNTDGPRTLEDAMDIARANGVDIPDDIEFIPSDKLAERTYAAYGGFQSVMRYRWIDFYARSGKIPVKIKQSILDSDEAIVAVLAHEMYELNHLRQMFEARETIPGDEIIRLIQVGTRGNLHDQAWDEADQLVIAMRGGQPCRP